MTLIPFPDVPNVEGVPPLPRLPQNQVTSIIQTVAANVPLLFAGQNTSQWGIYDSDGQIIGKTSDGTIANVSDAGPFTLAFDYRKETLISEFPIENGSFAAYNKVERPGNPVVTLIVSGTEDQRTAFLDAVDSACTSTDLYSVVTPEFVYYDHSIESYTYQRTNSRGANVLIVELSLKEIRSISAAYATAIQSPQNPSATPTVNGGMVQAQTSTQSTVKAANSKLSGASSSW